MMIRAPVLDMHLELRVPDFFGASGLCYMLLA